MTADIYLFLLAGSAGTTLGGLSGAPLGTVNGISGVYFYNDVPVSSGTVSGIFSAGGVGVLTGLTIVTNDFDDMAPVAAAAVAVPEPGAVALLLGGFTALLGVRRRTA